MKKILQIVIPILIAVFFIYLFLNGVDTKKLWNDIQSADLKYLYIAGAIALVSHFIRALRWRLLLGPLGFKPSTLNSFTAVMSAYFGNILIPRGGEVMRCMILKKSDNIPFASSFATVVAERVFDLICLLLLIGLSLILEFERFSVFLNSLVLNGQNTNKGLSLTNLIMIIGILGAIIFFVFKKHFLKIKFIDKIYQFVTQIFIQAFDSFRKLENKKLFLLHTLLIWLGYYFMTYLVFFSMPTTSHLGLMAGLIMLIVGGLGMSAPASGGIGAFHILTAGALTLFYGLSDDDGKAFAVIMHTSQTLVLLIFGGIAMLYSLTLKYKEPEQ